LDTKKIQNVCLGIKYTHICTFQGELLLHSVHPFLGPFWWLLPFAMGIWLGHTMKNNGKRFQSWNYLILFNIFQKQFQIKVSLVLGP
jgi:hypothetical protein